MTPRTVRLTLWLLALAAAVVFAGLNLGVTLKGGAGGPESTEAAPSLAGKPAPDFRLPTLEPYRAEWGETLALEDFLSERPLVVNFWASWCVPCRREAPLLEAAWQRHRGRVQFIGVNFQDQEAEALKFIEEFGQSFPSGADPRGEVGVAFGLFGVPTTYFIRPDGMIRAQKVGELSEEELDAYLKELLLARATDEPLARGR